MGSQVPYPKETKANQARARIAIASELARCNEIAGPDIWGVLRKHFPQTKRAHLVTAKLGLAWKNEPLREKNRTAHWQIADDRLSEIVVGDPVVLVMDSSDKKQGYPKRIYAGKFRTPHDTKQGYELQVDEFRLLGKVSRPIRAFLGIQQAPNIVNRLYAAPVTSPQIRERTDAMKESERLLKEYLGATELRWKWVRKNHDKFAKNVKADWGCKCAVTGIEGELLIASHIRPWSESSDSEKTSTDNGLLLCVPIDALFDRGLITFSNNGDLLVAKSVSAAMAKAYGISLEGKDGALSKDKLTRERRSFLHYHRKHVFRR